MDAPLSSFTLSEVIVTGALLPEAMLAEAWRYSAAAGLVPVFPMAVTLMLPPPEVMEPESTANTPYPSLPVEPPPP